MSGHISPKSTYYTIFGALMVLTVITIVVARIPLGSLNFPVAISIAITKATLVVLFFMHVKYSSKLTKMIVGMALFFLLTMFGLTMTDYLSRGWFASPGGSTGAGTQRTVSGGSGVAPGSQHSEAETSVTAGAPEH
jgi:cytochrome c oxidase subunit 4